MAVDRSAEIATLREALNAGVRRVTTDGTTTEFESAAAIRRRISELLAEDDTNNYRHRPPIVYGDLSTGF